MATTSAARGASPFQQERDVAIVAPETYDDSRRITDFLRSNRAVVLSTLDVDPGLARRLVDFTAGTAYALNAKIEMLDSGVYLICPQGTVRRSRDERATSRRELPRTRSGMRFVHDLITLYIWILIIIAAAELVPDDELPTVRLGEHQATLGRLTEPVLRPLRSILPRPHVGGVGSTSR